MGQKSQTVQQQWANQRDDLLIAIDQLSQMTEVMNDVLCRVKQQVDVLDSAHHVGENTTRRVQSTTGRTEKITKEKTTGTSKKSAENNRKKTDLIH